jgi:predicted LPLAT superfamily acyltransferase
VAGLNVDLNLASPDDFYAALVELHLGLTDEQSELVNARLILLLANHIGDIEVLREAMERAREAIEGH